MLRRLLLLALVLAAACGGGDDAPIDAGQLDAALADASTVGPDGTPPTACADSTECEDPSFAVCDESDGVCVQCVATADCDDFLFTHVCELDGQQCRECLGQDDCDDDPTALGPTCNVNRGYCECASHEECRGNANGRVCDPDFDSCTCVTDDDCDPPATCEDSFYLGEGKRTCQTAS